jgi:serine/threonine-protein kinase
MDFGIASSIETKGATLPGMMIGTPEYMSPEQIDGEQIDARSDIYSLGIIIYELLTGKTPFSGETPWSVAFKHKNNPPHDPREINPGIPESMSRIILKCLEKRKELRYQSAEGLLADLSSIDAPRNMFLRPAALFSRSPARNSPSERLLRQPFSSSWPSWGNSSSGGRRRLHRRTCLKWLSSALRTKQATQATIISRTPSPTS